MIDKGAVFSDCRTYRYSLTRIWNPAKGFVLFVCLNPSTADENIDDPTVRRCMRFSGVWGYGGMIMGNIFALRSTDPGKLYNVADPIGPENDDHLKSLSIRAAVTVCAWGIHGALKDRGEYVLRHLIEGPHCLALTKDRFPRHPLYLKKDLKPIPYEAA